MKNDPHIDRIRNGESRRPAYRKAPIAEAVLDIRTRLPQEVTLQTLEQIKDAAYPNQRRPIQFQLKLQQQGEELPTLSHELNALGFVYGNDDNKQVVQFRNDGFSFSRLAPYEDWDAFAGEAKRLWTAYKGVATPAVIELLGLNYVNHLKIPFAKAFEEYFKAYIEIPKPLPQELNAFSFAFQVGDPEKGPLVHVAQTYGPFTEDDGITVIMNVQTFKNINLPSSEFSEDQLWSVFQNLREAKNEAFEACITDEMRKVFQ